MYLDQFARVCSVHKIVNRQNRPPHCGVIPLRLGRHLNHHMEYGMDEVCW